MVGAFGEVTNLAIKCLLFSVSLRWQGLLLNHLSRSFTNSVPGNSSSIINLSFSIFII